MNEDTGYPKKLLQRVMNEPLSEATILALEQLSYLEGGGVDEELTTWLQGDNVHPLLQFRTLQTLKRRGMQGTVKLIRGHEKVLVEIESVPLQTEDFPPQVSHVLERVAGQAEVHEPTLYYFAQELCTSSSCRFMGRMNIGNCWKAKTFCWIFGQERCTNLFLRV